MPERNLEELREVVKPAQRKLEYDIRLANATLDLFMSSEFINYLAADWGENGDPIKYADQHARNFIVEADKVVSLAVKGDSRIPVTSYKRIAGEQDPRLTVHGPALKEAIRIFDGGAMMAYDLKIEELPSPFGNGQSSDILVFVKKDS